MDAFISKEILDMISYRSALGQNLKQISLRETPLERILDDIAKYRSSYIDVLVQENLIGSRFKSEDSILRKYEKTLLTGGGFKQCFNDVLGFQLRNIRTNSQTISVLSTYAKVRGPMTAIAQSISTTSEIIWPIRLRFSCGTGKAIFSTSGAISIFTNT